MRRIRMHYDEVSKSEHALRTGLPPGCALDRRNTTYKTPRPIRLHRAALFCRLIRRFQKIVMGRRASARSIKAHQPGQVRQ